MRSTFAQLALAILLLATPASAQQGDQKSNPPAAPPAGESSSKPQPVPPTGESSSKPQPPPPVSASDPGTYDPVSAQEDLEVGTYYLHKGDIDAAIARFQDAIRLRSNFAKPRLMLGELYEKKGDKADAVKYYKEYLQVLPKAPDAKKIQNRIDKLSSE
jgi:tetratricopeptide (TPR) repeat protein